MTSMRMLSVTDWMMATVRSLSIAVRRLMKNTLPNEPPIIDAIAKIIDMYLSIFTLPLSKRKSDTVAMANTQTADKIPIVGKS